MFLFKKLTVARSRLAAALVSTALKCGTQNIWLWLIGTIMPPSLSSAPLRLFSRRQIRKIARETESQPVDKLIESLNARYPRSSWVAAFSAHYYLHQRKYLPAERYLAELLEAEPRLAKKYGVLLVDCQIENGHTREATRTVSALPPSNDRDLLAASAVLENEAQWLDHLNRFLAAADVSSVQLEAGSASDKFRRLSGSGCSVELAQRRPPKVTIIVSCFNAEDYVEVSLGSLIAQSHKNLEIIAIDDKSSDGTWRVLTRIAAGDSRIRLLRNPKNVGTYVSRNRALKASTGDYVTSQDSDDWSHPDRILRQVELLEAYPAAVASYCAGIRMRQDGRFEVHELGRILRSVCYPSLMYRKSVMMSLTGYWDCVRVEADNEYFRRVLRLRGDASVQACAAPLMIQLRREGSLTTMNETKYVRDFVSDHRLAYRLQARKFARTLRPENACYDFEAWKRPFPAPAAITVPEELVHEASQWGEA